MRLSESLSFLYIGTYFKEIVRHVRDKKQKNRSVNNFRTNYFVRLLGICGILNGPTPPTPIPGVNIKVPFQGKQIWKHIVFLKMFVTSMKENKEKNEICTKMILASWSLVKTKIQKLASATAKLRFFRFR